MADTKISALSAATLPLDGTEVLPVVQGGVSKKVTTAGLVWTQVEINFGDTPTRSKTFTISDAAVTSTTRVAVTPSGKVAAGRVGDDWAWDGLILSALSGAGSFALTALAVPGPVVGKRYVQYQLG